MDCPAQAIRWGGLKVDVNYLDTSADLEALGAAGRTAFEISATRTGPAAPQTPCEDKADEKCMALSCPDLISAYSTNIKKVLGEINPAAADMIATPAASVIAPQTIEPGFCYRSTNY